MRNLTQDQQQWLFEAKQAEKQRAPKGQSCLTCKHSRRWEYARNIYYCAAQKSTRTQNGMAKTKARDWCGKWEAKP